MARKKSKSDILYQKIEEMHKDVKEIREKDIPNIKVDVAVVKEKASMHAKIISAAGGLLAVAISSAIALLN